MNNQKKREEWSVKITATLRSSFYGGYLPDECPGELELTVHGKSVKLPMNHADYWRLTKSVTPGERLTIVLSSQEESQ